MVFSSLTFLFFFLPIVLLVNMLLPKQVRNYWLLFASLFFYAWGAHEFVFVMMASILMNYTFARLIDLSDNIKFRRLFLTLGVAGNLGILCYNKYMNFFTQNIHDYFDDSVVVTEIILPIGISFFTFQAISYIVDVYRKETPVQKNPYYLGLYIAFFPQLIAGPIVRYHTIAEQIENRSITLEKFADGVMRFCCGFAMKILLANNLAIITEAAFRPGLKPSIAFAWLGALAYSLQIFFDFGGYSTMAIGLGRMFGFDFPQNFNYPYITKTVSEFWRRWHISLGMWFRDYVFFPMGGSRVESKWKLVRNLFIVWLLTGIWHGAGWLYILWGMMYFLLITFEKLTGLAKKKLSLVPETFYRIFALICIMLVRVTFRSVDFTMFITYISTMFGLTDSALYDNNAIRYANDYKYLILIAIICSTPALAKIRDWLQCKLKAEEPVGAVFMILAIALTVLSVSSLVISAHNPFIYFNF